ncbi:Tartrate-resistant acid phosphatase type 5 [Thelohanellus kitauei]|uniref:Tartrate-resistant acid phosphatase type 5 n=1 Tax=Thelohanellus kitauei TaxID=669202 RepID=A0A0C2MWK7_THEKT|nr:Tartrate-resistant acid phosphatase type 5 [Thelohanellus kitauei]
MSTSKRIQAKLTMFCLLTIFVIRAQKLKEVNDNEINVVVIGDAGLTESESQIKKMVVARIKEKHAQRPFQLGINLGDNVYENGSETDDFETLYQIFTESFPPHIFDFDFLTVLGNHDHMGDPDTQIKFHHGYDQRFYMPDNNYHYDVRLIDGTLIRFVCVDSMPLYDPNLATSTERQNQISFLMDLLDDSGGFDYVFLILHHNVVRGCGPHRRVPHDFLFLQLITHKYLTAILNGHNHNMQMFDRLWKRPPVFSVGNSARVNPAEVSETENGWCKSPATGGFAQLIISNQLATIRYFSGKGQLLVEEEL